MNNIKVKDHLKEIEESGIGEVVTITNCEGRKVQIVRTPYGVGLANVRRPGITDEQLAQLKVSPHPVA